MLITIIPISFLVKLLNNLNGVVDGKNGFFWMRLPA